MQHLDEGMIHAWLDEQLPRDEAQAVEAHVAECRQCADAVAEARGLIAASSRILMALDGVPREVVPLPVGPRVEAGAVTGPPSSLTASTPSRAERRAQRRWFSAPSLAAAAAVVVAVGTFALTRASDRRPLGEGATSQLSASPTSGPSLDSASPSPASVATTPVPAAPSAVALGKSSTAPTPAKDAPVPADVRSLRDDAGGRQVAQNAVRSEADAPKAELQRRAQAGDKQGFSAKTSVTDAPNESTADRLEARRQVAAAPPLAAVVDERKKAREELPLPLAKPSTDSSARVVLRGASSLAGRVDSSSARADAAAKEQAPAKGVLRGRVIDANNTGLAGAMVTVVGSTTGVATNTAGEFTLGGLAAGEHQLTVRRIGYGEVKRDIVIVAGQTVTADVTVSPSVLSLEQVVTTGSASSRQVPSAPTPDRGRRAAPNPEPAPGAPITATQSNAAGCYELGITPTAAQVRTGFRQVPRRIALDTDIVPANAEGVWYRARDLARVGTLPNGLWRPTGPESVEIEWTYGTRTGHVRLAGSAGSMMRGTIEEIDRAAATGEAGTVVAVRRSCDG